MKQIAAILAATFLAMKVASAAGFWDQGMVLGKARTEYPSGYGVGHNIGLYYPEPTPEGCLFPATGNTFGCPGRNNVGTLWSGTIQSSPFCRGSSTLVGDSWQGCLQYSSNNYYSINAPGSSYWVISANSDPSFDQCNSGPPNLSFPITSNTGGGMFKVWTTDVTVGGAKRMNMMMDMANHNWVCPLETDPTNPTHLHYTIPFLAVGAHVGRGQTAALQQMNTSTPHNNSVTFKTKVWGYTPFSCKAGTDLICPQTGVRAGFLMEATWNGVPRMAWVELFDAGYFTTAAKADHGNWNWPVSDSMWFPGADLSIWNVSALSTLCGINLPATTTSSTTYTVYATDIFKCMSDWGYFHDHMPAGTNVSLNGFQWFQESLGTAGAFWWTVEGASVL